MSSLARSVVYALRKKSKKMKFLLNPKPKKKLLGTKRAARTAGPKSLKWERALISSARIASKDT